MALRDSLVGVAEANRRAQSKVREKKALSEEYDDVYFHGARVFESYCRLVGEDEIADQVRPSEPRSTRAESEPDSPLEGQPEEDAEQETAGESSEPIVADGSVVS